MIGIEWLAAAAVVLAALAVLPGTLGILAWTHKIAASAAGARFVYGRAIWVLLLSAAAMAVGAYKAVSGGNIPLVFLGLAAVYAGILVFGFFMHVKLLFKPIRVPIFISLEKALEKYGPEEEVVGVIDDKGKPWAFVARLARRPHIVYQPDGEKPFVMTHCILAHSSMSYAMEGRFAKPDIDVTAVLANNMVFYERSNKCAVIQMHNKSRDGSMALRTVPTVMCSLKTWSKLYPASKVWMRDIEWRDIFYLKLLSRADVIDPKSPVMVYPLEHGLDERLPMKSQVIGVQAAGTSRTYPVSLFADGKLKLVQDEIAGIEIAIFAGHGGNYIQVYEAQADGESLTFKAAGKDKFKDRETNSQWTVMGECVSGKLKGKSLSPVAHYNKIFWYVWADFNPGTDIYEAETPAAKSRKKSAA